jgi:hypothetical protein
MDLQTAGKRKASQISEDELDEQHSSETAAGESSKDEIENALPATKEADELGTNDDCNQLTMAAAAPPVAAATPAVVAGLKNSYDALRWILVANDGKSESLIKLVALKSLFAKQLPKMPRSYIARLVFDRRHTSLAILSDTPSHRDSDEEVIGGICYRAFPDMRFAEIAFCAVSASYQVKV